MRSYKPLTKQVFSINEFSIVPLRMKDRYDIMQWRNEQIYHLRQDKPLTEEDQDQYFNTVVTALFEKENPEQILFSYLEGDTCIGYGGLVHINWIDQNAELSFVMNTSLERDHFKFHWKNFSNLIEKVAFDDLGLHKIYTYAFDLRQNLYLALEEEGFRLEGELREHHFYQSKYIDVKIHSKINSQISYRKADLEDAKLLFGWANEEEVRRNSINSGLIKWEDHYKWFLSKINSRNSKIFIFYKKAEPIGQVRLDFEEGFWLINYSICKTYRGKGYGIRILKKIVDTGRFKKFKAFVKPENIASLKIFKKLGFIETKEEVTEKSELIEFRYEI